MKLSDFISEKHQYRMALCGHKAVEAGAVCLVLMSQGRLAEMGLAHLAIASKTGLLAVFPALGVTFTRYARHFANRWTASLFLGTCTFFADAAVHRSHYPGAYTEAAMTAVGACAFSLAISLHSHRQTHRSHNRDVFLAPKAEMEVQDAALDGSTE